MPNAQQSGSLRVVIADDHAVVREGLRLILSSEKQFQVVGQASDGKEALELSSRLDPDILLLDLDMPRMNGLETLRQLAEGKRNVKVIVLTASIENQEIVQALRLGARGVILKEAPPQLLMKCIHCVSRGEYWIGREAVSDLIRGLQSLIQTPPETEIPFGLTSREREIISAVLQGDSNKDVATRLAISEQTVKNHLTNIFNKIGVSSRLELALFAAKHRLVQPE